MNKPLSFRPRLPQPGYTGDAGEFTDGEIVTYTNPEADQLSVAVRTYLGPVFAGLAVTGGRFFRHMGSWTLWLFWFLRGKKDAPPALALRRKATVTTYYPEYERPDITRINRGKHVLTQRANGEPQCVACFMCATACPAWCIHIVGGEHPDPRIEKYPVKFDIEIDKCIFCGYCEEACPVDAIRLSTDYHTTDYFRERMIYDRDFLLTWNPTKVEEEHIYPGGAPRSGDE
jgi:NADH-quinone oxidoreductase subunit I